MQDDCIAVALGLTQLKILWQKELEDHFEVTVIYRWDKVTCPRCGMVTTKEHDRRQQHKQDRRLRDKVVFLTLIKRRFRCLWCGKVFTEPDEVFGSRRRLQGGNRRGKRGDLFRSRYTPLKGAERLTDWEKAKLNQLFYRYPTLKRAWMLKESFRAWYRGMDRSKAEERLASLEKTISNDSPPEFKELLHTLTNWREEILNYFDYPITNGFVEGKNNRIKTIKRMAYGYRNMNNFRLRILATNSKGARSGFSHLLT